MKANEARQLTEQAFSTATNAYIMSAYKQIEVAAKDGHSCITIKSPTDNGIIRASAINQLIKDGYDVKHDSGYNHHECYNWDYLNISW